MELLTVAEIKRLAGVSQQAVSNALARHPEFVRSYAHTGGRPALLISSEILALWKPAAAGLMKPAPGGAASVAPAAEARVSRPRKGRADKGAPRKVSSATLTAALEYARAEYYAAAIPDVRSAAARAVSRLREISNLPDSHVQPYEVDCLVHGDWFYRRYLMRQDASFTGPVHSERWKLVHALKWRRHESSLNVGSVHYDIAAIGEADFGFGPGSGFARWVMVDDRQSDSGTGTHAERAVALYAWCVLTGALLWVEPCPAGITTQSYARVVLAVCHLYGRDGRRGWFLENARAAISNRLVALIHALYTADELAEFRGAWHRLTGSDTPIARNVPHIPRHFGKATGERLFGGLRRRDAYAFPLTFRGAGPQEQVQLTRRNINPQVPAALAFTADDYFTELLGFVWGEYLDQPRPALRHWAQRTGQQPTIRARRDYYTPPAGSAEPLPPSQIAEVLYWAQEKWSSVKMSRAGELRVQIASQQLFLSGSALWDYALVGRRLTVVPLPQEVVDGAYAVFLSPSTTTGDRPQFVGLATDHTARTVGEAHAMRTELRAHRERLFATATAVAGDLLLPRRHSGPAELPEVPEWHRSVGGLDPALSIESSNSGTDSDELDDLDSLLSDADSITLV